MASSLCSSTSVVLIFHFFSAVFGQSIPGASFLSGNGAPGAGQYALVDDYEGASNFFNKFNYYSSYDPTYGHVQYVNESVAIRNGYTTTSNHGSAVISVDTTNRWPNGGPGRPSVRLISDNTYTHGLFILDLLHMPWGCGTWPAYWLLGPSWPSNGEIDIIEGVNTIGTDSVTLHTTSGCIISGSGQTATFQSNDCSGGCGSVLNNATTPNNYGDNLNSNGGGVYATEWTSNYIKTWFFPRSNIPASITSGAPNPNLDFGQPAVNSQGPCSFDQHFNNMSIIINIDFCGEWAGQVYRTGYPSCPQTLTALTSLDSCVDFVGNNPSYFTNAYWDIRSLKVYQMPPGATPASSYTTSLTSAAPLASTQTLHIGMGATTSTLSSSAYNGPLSSLSLTALPTSLSSSISTICLSANGTIWSDIFSQNYNIRCGSDYAALPASVAVHGAATFEECLEFCDSLVGCTAASFVAGNGLAGAGTCYPKSGHGAFVWDGITNAALRVAGPVSVPVSSASSSRSSTSSSSQARTSILTSTTSLSSSSTAGSPSPSTSSRSSSASSLQSSSSTSSTIPITVTTPSLISTSSTLSSTATSVSPTGSTISSSSSTLSSSSRSSSLSTSATVSASAASVTLASLQRSTPTSLTYTTTTVQTTAIASSTGSACRSAVCDLVTGPSIRNQICQDSRGNAFSENCGVEYIGSILATRLFKNLDFCMQGCDDTVGCIAVNYYNGTCGLLSAITGSITIPGTAGIVAATRAAPVLSTNAGTSTTITTTAVGPTSASTANSGTTSTTALGSVTSVSTTNSGTLSTTTTSSGAVSVSAVTSGSISTTILSSATSISTTNFGTLPTTTVLSDAVSISAVNSETTSTTTSPQRSVSVSNSTIGIIATTTLSGPMSPSTVDTGSATTITPGSSTSDTNNFTSQTLGETIADTTTTISSSPSDTGISGSSSSIAPPCPKQTDTLCAAPNSPTNCSDLSGDMYNLECGIGYYGIILPAARLDGGGKLLKYNREATIRACQMLCHNNTGCVGMNYQGKNCTLFRAVTGKTFLAGGVAGSVILPSSNTVGTSLSVPTSSNTLVISNSEITVAPTTTLSFVSTLTLSSGATVTLVPVSTVRSTISPGDHHKSTSTGSHHRHKTAKSRSASKKEGGGSSGSNTVSLCYTCGLTPTLVTGGSGSSGGPSTSSRPGTSGVPDTSRSHITSRRHSTFGGGSTSAVSSTSKVYIGSTQGVGDQTSSTKDLVCTPIPAFGTTTLTTTYTITNCGVPGICQVPGYITSGHATRSEAVVETTTDVNGHTLMRTYISAGGSGDGGTALAGGGPGGHQNSGGTGTQITRTATTTNTAQPTCPASNEKTFTSPFGMQYAISCDQAFYGSTLDTQTQSSLGSCIATCDMFNIRAFMSGSPCVGVTYHSSLATKNCELKTAVSSTVLREGADSARLVSLQNGQDGPSGPAGAGGGSYNTVSVVSSSDHSNTPVIGGTTPMTIHPTGASLHLTTYVVGGTTKVHTHIRGGSTYFVTVTKDGQTAVETEVSGGSTIRRTQVVGGSTVVTTVTDHAVSMASATVPVHSTALQTHVTGGATILHTHVTSGSTAVETLTNVGGVGSSGSPAVGGVTGSEYGAGSGSSSNVGNSGSVSRVPETIYSVSNLVSTLVSNGVTQMSTYGVTTAVSVVYSTASPNTKTVTTTTVSLSVSISDRTVTGPTVTQGGGQVTVTAGGGDRVTVTASPSIIVSYVYPSSSSPTFTCRTSATNYLDGNHGRVKRTNKRSIFDAAGLALLADMGRSPRPGAVPKP